jgi:hypothetical protein
MSISEKLIDKRIVARNIKKGLIQSDEYQQLLSELPDRSDNIYKPEEAGQDEGADLQPDDATPEIKTTEPVAVQTSSPEPHDPAVKPQAISVEERPAPRQDTRRQPGAPASSFGTSEPYSNQSESQPDPRKPPFDKE